MRGTVHYPLQVSDLKDSRQRRDGAAFPTEISAAWFNRLRPWQWMGSRNLDRLLRLVAGARGSQRLRVTAGEIGSRRSSRFRRGLVNVEDCIFRASQHIETLAGGDVALVIAGDSAGANRHSRRCCITTAGALRASIAILPGDKLRLQHRELRGVFERPVHYPRRHAVVLQPLCERGNCGRTRAYRRCARRT